VVGSDGAARRDPQWWKNLQANPQGRIRMGRDVFPVETRLAEGAERERLWERGKSVNPAWERYEKRTERVLPVVVLTPGAVGPAAGLKDGNPSRPDDTHSRRGHDVVLHRAGRRPGGGMALVPRAAHPRDGSTGALSRVERIAHLHRTQGPNDGVFRPGVEGFLDPTSRDQQEDHPWPRH
jgi:hypothetical protein